MKLIDLEPQFVRLVPGQDKTWEYVGTLAEAQGIFFLCPKCFEENKGRIGTHMVLCWFNGRGVPNEMDPGPGRWNPNGTDFENLSFVPGEKSCSILLQSGCK